MRYPRAIGCSHMIVGPNNGHAFYEPDQAKELVLKYADQLKITAVPIEAMQYVPDRQRFMPVSEIQKQKLESIEYTDAQLKKDLALGESLPDWFSYPEVVRELRRVYPPRSKQGLTLFFTGFQVRKVHARQDYLCQIGRGGWAPRITARWRHRASASVQRTRFPQSASRPEYSTHRFCRQ